MNIPIKQYLELLRSYLKPQGVRVLGLAVLLFSGIGLQLLSPQVIRYFIDTVQMNGAQQALVNAGLLFIIIILAQRVAATATTYMSEQVAWTATNHLRTDVARHVLQLDMSFHNRHTPGELLERIDGDVDRLANFFSKFILEILSGGLLAIGVLVLLFWEDWRVGLALAIFALIYLAVHAWDQKWAAPHWRLERQYAAELFGFVGERISGLKDIQTSDAGHYTLRRFHDHLRRLSWQALKADVITDAGWTTSKIVFDLGTVTGMGLGAYLFLNGALTIGTVYLIIHYLTMLNRPLNRIASQLEDLQRVRVSIERVDSLLQTKPAIVDGAGATLSSNQAFSVRFDKVSFGYSDEKQVLHQISFDLPPGQVLGLLGRTGSGKTSLSRLLFRLYDATGGHIYLDEIDLRRVPLADLRRRVGMVTQEVQLFQASIRDNLTLFDDAISDAQILKSLQTLGLENWYDALPNGLDTMLAANDGKLSAGEGQLLALTRVFLNDPGLIILDEASSRLDPATEQLLEQAMDRLLHNRTTIIIAHRLATIQRADQILILDQGRIKEYGPYQRLISDPDSMLTGLFQTGLHQPMAAQEVLA